MVIGFCYNVKHNEPSLEASKQVDLEFDSPQVIESIRKAIESLGHEIIMLEADMEVFDKLKANKEKIDMVFTIAEGLGGDARESQVPMFCEILGIPYTHSAPTTHAIGLNKQMTKYVLSGVGIRVPLSVVIRKKEEKIEGLEFPLIVKPNKEGSSKGVFDKNVVGTKAELKRRVAEMLEDFGGEIIVEEYIEGREFTVSLINNGGWRVLPIVEQKFDFLPKGYKRIASFELKWLYEDSLSDLTKAYDCPAKLGNNLQQEIEETSIKVCEVLEVKDCARIDYRLNSSGKLYFLEINTLPGINPDEKIISYFPLAARTAGMSFAGLLGEIIEGARKRWELEEFTVKPRC